MIKKLDFKQAKNFEEMAELFLNKTDEIIDRINSMEGKLDTTISRASNADKRNI
ncbi:hypothetical protein [Clostridium algidicarnis]|uniref:hypothetical protein n=1 Tax=Clostridium algidicarnis TaxID=37659 RepID=UPI003FD880AB